MIDKYKGFKWTTPILLIILLDYFNIWIPRFCYHTKLSSSGNCRMCLVEVRGSLKPLIACCTLFNKNMVIYTNTDLVRKSREYIMEFLLINHPLDCPICDQAGECDLQDLSLVYGSDDSRFKYQKKAILNKNIGGLIKTNMNRCIYCTRCVRYTSELNNIFMFNTLGRGGYVEIGNYSQLDFHSNYIDGNVIDLCPVGALTSKPYSFRNRTWELSSIESIDILDSLCSHIRIDTINNVIERILPKPNNSLNEEWITDKIRFCYDGFKKQRLSFPSYKVTLNNIDCHIITSWFLVFHKINIKYLINFNLLKNNSFFSIFTGNLLDLFSLYLIKTFSSYIGITKLNINLNLNFDLRKYFLFNTNVNLLDLNNFFFFIGVNAKTDSPILNLKIRNLKFRHGNKITIGYIGNHIFSNYSLSHIGISNHVLLKILLGKSFLNKSFKEFKNSLFFFSTFYSNLDKFSFSLDLFSIMSKKFNFISNMMTFFSSDVSLYELGIVSYYYNKSKFIVSNELNVIYLVGVDYNYLNFSKNKFIIYQGHHGDIGIKYANIVLPSTTFVENTTLYLNCEGKLFVANAAITKKKKMAFNETILYNLFNMFSSNSYKTNKFILKLFIFFFYKIPFFLVKYKSSLQLFTNINFFSNLNSIFFYSINYSVNNISNYYEWDVISKSSYHLTKLKHKKLNF